jgi:hypothetical protein
MELINMVATLLILSLSLSLFLILLPIITFAQSDHLEVPTIAQIPSVEEQSQRGFLILTTNVINDKGGSKQAADFTINVLGSPAFPSILQAAQTPKVKFISIQEGYYSISLNNTQGYNTSFGNQCEGQMKAGDIKSCSITLDESSTTIDQVTTTPQLPLLPLSLPSLLLPSSPKTSEAEEKLTISQIPSIEEDQSELGFLVVGTNVINDNGGLKQAPDFTINVLGSPAFPSSFQAAHSNLMQVISIQEGEFFVSVSNFPEYTTSFGNQCEGQIKAGEIKTCLITVNDKGTTTPPPPPPPPPPAGDVDAKFAELIKTANPNELIILDGSGSTGTITSWSIVQTAGQPSVVLENAPAKPFSKQFIMPNTEDTLKFTLTVRNDQTGKQDTDMMTVSKTLTTPPPPPPPPGNLPVSNVTWFYDSKNALSKDMTLKSGSTHPQDRVLLSSGASGVSSHPIKNGFIEVQSGGGNGRVYWNYHEVPQFSQLPTAGFNTAMTGTFIFKPGIDNLSIKDGNHNTDGWVLNGKYAFGGFGLAFHRDNVESKAEYWHNNQGSGLTVSYPNGLQLVDNKEYKFFLTLVTDRVKQEVVLNAWLDFGDGKGWIQVMKDRKWGQSGWSPGSVPNGEDKADILKGPSFIKKHHIWTRANGGSSLPVKDIMIGTLPFIS